MRRVVQAPGRRGVAAGAAGEPTGVLRVAASVWVSVSAGLIWIEPHDQHPRDLDLSKSLPRHPRRNFTESRVGRRALARRRTSRNELCRASRPKHTEALGKLVCVTNKRLTIQAQTYARAQAVTGTPAVLHDAQILATVSSQHKPAALASSGRSCSASALDLAPSGTPPPSVVNLMLIR